MHDKTPPSKSKINESNWFESIDNFVDNEPGEFVSISK